MMQPWYHESGQGNLFNEWTPAHIAWGVVAQLVLGHMLAGLALHTAYELAEDRIYPREGRDRSLTNNVGDTIAFVAGQLLVKVTKKAIGK